MKTLDALKILEVSGLKILTLEDLKKLLGIERDNTAYKTAESFVKKEILTRLRKGLYAYAFSPPDDFEVANFLYPPSCISLETALNFYGMLSQFPYAVTSVTPRKTRRFDARGKRFEYVHIQKDLFFGYRKEKGFLIAEPEKALLDEIYLVSKGWRTLDFGDLDLSMIDRAKFREIAARVTGAPFRKLRKELKL